MAEDDGSVLVTLTDEGVKKEYWCAVGEFVTWFAQVENMLAHLLKLKAKLDAASANAILSGTRIERAMDLITRLHAETNAPSSVIADFAYIFPQIKKINTVRNLLLHYGTDFNESIGGEFSVSNAADSSGLKLKRAAISSPILKEMIHDLLIIIDYLADHILREFGTPASRIDELLPSFRERRWKYVREIDAGDQARTHKRPSTL